MSKQEGNIIWLASYPKSGNTWLRIFLNNLLSKEKPISINNLRKIGRISSSRFIFDELMGLSSSDLKYDEIDYYLPKVHLLRSQRSSEREFVKTHDAYLKNNRGQWTIPMAATFKVIYLVRNPLDVCVSLAYHLGHRDFDKIITFLANEQEVTAITRKKPNSQLHQYLGSWSSHVKSWQDVPQNKILVVKYEDMRQKTLETFSKIVQFLEIPHTKENIVKAIENSQIDKLKILEDEHGFVEKMHKAKRFFRKGVIGGWREELSEKQAEQIVFDHRDVMIYHNYITPKGQLNI